MWGVIHHQWQDIYDRVQQGVHCELRYKLCRIYAGAELRGLSGLLRLALKLRCPQLHQ